ncbi:oligosaccharide flippase family protein [Chryseobacterium sp. 3008163]|uniref:oligosaccharide flippase family protein n=1 Tax=Chryseobacterium sp. 3008163 TaxID=2478663 RepID=UPI000F0C4B15|nr:oligosaccharide flippase family protein [Chryseobacterium sp. 3008163]AYM99967.1 hypothetical protein EAG08_06115 [Chryseobacterium sp. 3008163]
MGIDIIIEAGFLIPLLYLLLSANALYLQIGLSIGKINVILFSMVVFCVVFSTSLFAFLYVKCFDFHLSIFLPFLLALSSQLFTYFFTLKIYPKLNFNSYNLSIIFKFGFPLFIATYLGVFTLHIDKIIINKLGGISAFAIYSIGALEIPFVGLVTKSITSISYPKIVRHIEKKEFEEANNIWINDVKRASYFIFPLVFFCILFSKQIIIGLFGDKYYASIPVFEAYCLILIWRNATYGTILSVKGKTNYIALVSFVSLIVNVILIYFFYQKWEVVGIVRALFCSVLVLVMSTLYLEGSLKKYLSLFKDKLIFGMLLAIFILYFFKQ